jgi:hypothetical protein
MIAGVLAGVVMRGVGFAFGDCDGSDRRPSGRGRARDERTEHPADHARHDARRPRRFQPASTRSRRRRSTGSRARECGSIARTRRFPVTGPSHTTILTGRGPWEHGNLLNGLALPAGLPLLSEVLRSDGYATAAFVSGFVLDGDLGFARGFDVYDDDFAGTGAWRDTSPGALLAMATRRLHPDARPRTARRPHRRPGARVALPAARPSVLLVGASVRPARALHAAATVGRALLRGRIRAIPDTTRWSR